SMGNYIFKREFLEEILLEDAKDKESTHDFGKDILPKVYKYSKVFVYDFSTNKIKGELAPYWRDVGTIREYYEAHRDILKEPPLLNLHNPDWPIRTISYRDPPAYIAKNVYIENSLIAEGTKIYENAKIINSIISRNCVIEENSIIEDSILHYGVIVKKGGIVRKCIIDKFGIIDENDNVRENLKENYFIDGEIIIIPSPPPKLRIHKNQP
ncbi:MAG: sugar phosphate nucleotidyltransferase, partial [candidate division WOR-3 bacterium]